jgi:hypothetical protein
MSASTGARTIRAHDGGFRTPMTVKGIATDVAGPRGARHCVFKILTALAVLIMAGLSPLQKGTAQSPFLTRMNSARPLGLGRAAADPEPIAPENALLPDHEEIKEAALSKRPVSRGYLSKHRTLSRGRSLWDSRWIMRRKTRATPWFARLISIREEPAKSDPDVLACSREPY